MTPEEEEGKKELVRKYINPRKSVRREEIAYKGLISGIEIALYILVPITLGYFVGKPFGNVGIMLGFFIGAILGLVLAVRMALRMTL
jgi:hypothetical protein